jgi:molybdopterin-guanine dinucleotide biosynthesis protein A
MREDCAAVLLAGGRSSRMGRPKAWLEFSGTPLLSLLAARLARFFPEIVVVAAPGQELPEHGGATVTDQRPGEGPLAGLETAMAAVRRPFLFLTSCDVPFLAPALAVRLAELAEEGCGYDAVVPEWEGRLHPLQAVYRTGIREVVSGLLAAGRRRPVDLFGLVRTRTVGEEEVRASDPTGLTLYNMNSPGDYERALQWWPEWYAGQKP